jgi:hypothetical protein
MPGFSPARADLPATDRPAQGRSGPARPPASDGDDEFIAGLLIRMWALASGRTLRSDIRPEQLNRDELIRFWADDLTPASGRHAGDAACPTWAAR